MESFRWWLEIFELVSVVVWFFPFLDKGGFLTQQFQLPYIRWFVFCCLATLLLGASMLAFCHIFHREARIFAMSSPFLCSRCYLILMLVSIDSYHSVFLHYGLIMDYIVTVTLFPICASNSLVRNVIYASLCFSSWQCIGFTFSRDCVFWLKMYKNMS